MTESLQILNGDCREQLKTLPDQSVHCVVTSPPYYGLRDYGVDGQIGLEESPQEFINEMVSVFREIRRVLRDDGTVWLNIGDSYNTKPHGDADWFDPKNPKGRDRKAGSRPNRRPLVGFKPKDKMLVPHRLAIALQEDGWWVRQDNVWHKPSPMPSSVRDNTTVAHEYVFLLTKSARYHYDWFAISEPCVYGSHNSHFHVGKTAAQKNNIGTGPRTEGDRRNKRSVWKIASDPYPGAHFACFPTKLAETCILAGCPDQCCEQCGKPYERIIDTDRVPSRPGNNSKVGRVIQHEDSPYESMNGSIVGNRDPKRHVTKYVDRGFKPQCDCDSKPIGGVVLDPFLGSGTTLRVAKLLGRRGIGIELNPEYVELAWKRIGNQKMLPI